MTAGERDRVATMAHEDPAGAAKLARAIDDAYYRAQAYGWVTRHAPARDVSRFAQLAVVAAADAGDAYRQATASAWVLRALLERGRRDEALTMLEVVLPSVARIAQPAGRAEALFLLLQAVFDAGEEVRRSFLHALAELRDADDHWRVDRAFREALVICRPVDAEHVAKLARVADEKAQRRLDRALASETREPRPFFW